MAWRYSILLLAALAVWHTSAAGAVQLQHSSSCGKRLPAATEPGPAASLRGERIQVLSWNIQKNSGAQWREELRRLAHGADLVLLQEAILEAPWEAVLEGNYEAVFSPGYRTAKYRSGVLTISAVSAAGHCSLSHREPLLGTPKATNISRYPILGQTRQLLVVNLHGVNFSLGGYNLSTQLNDSGSLVEKHRGPVIFAGDFNTWSEARMAKVKAVIKRLKLRPLTYTDDQRSRVFGQALDHIFVRGLRVIEAGAASSGASDHGPVHATLALEE
ncbi:MAG: endonuclease/exonuclease/phosphatase family protein [Halieaceae bacterium]|nr:endonuclease/exonuclease/phosphatase family protein [Halieaceae bacterium]